jgi:hypothetical protein
MVSEKKSDCLVPLSIAVRMPTCKGTRLPRERLMSTAFAATVEEEIVNRRDALVAGPVAQRNEFSTNQI